MTSRLFDPNKVLAIFEKKLKAKEDRTMFYAFPKYVRSHATQSEIPHPSKSDVQQEALVYFGKKDEFEAVVRDKQLTRRIKELFNGHLVMEWTAVLYWGTIKKIMDKVRERIGGDDWREIMVEMSLEQVKALTIEVKDVVLMENTKTCEQEDVSAT